MKNPFWFISRSDLLFWASITAAISLALYSCIGLGSALVRDYSPKLAAPTKSQADQIRDFYNNCKGERVMSLAVEGGSFSIKATCGEDVRWK
jgi:hypothetical protein